MFQYKSSVGSRIKIEVLGIDGAVRDTYHTENIMTDFGLLNWARAAMGSHIAIGSGSQTEAGSVTSLANYVRNQSGTWAYSDVNFIDEMNGVMRTDHTLTVLFPLETAAQNYSELGINTNNQHQLQTYALIRDSTGEPTSVSVLAGEQVRVDYVVQFSTPLLDVVEKEMNGVLTTVTTIPLATGQTNGVRLPNTPANASRYWPAGQGVPEPAVVPPGGTQGPRNATISEGQYSQLVQLGELNLDGGISLIRLGGTANNVGIMVHFDPPIMKTDGLNMTVSVTSNLVNGEFYA